MIILAAIAFFLQATVRSEVMEHCKICGLNSALIEGERKISGVFNSLGTKARVDLQNGCDVKIDTSSKISLADSAEIIGTSMSPNLVNDSECLLDFTKSTFDLHKRSMIQMGTSAKVKIESVKGKIGPDSHVILSDNGKLSFKEIDVTFAGNVPMLIGYNSSLKIEATQKLPRKCFDFTEAPLDMSHWNSEIELYTNLTCKSGSSLTGLVLDLLVSEGSSLKLALNSKNSIKNSPIQLVKSEFETQHTSQIAIQNSTIQAWYSTSALDGKSSLIMKKDSIISMYNANFIAKNALISLKSSAGIWALQNEDIDAKTEFTSQNADVMLSDESELRLHPGSEVKLLGLEEKRSKLTLKSSIVELLNNSYLSIKKSKFELADKNLTLIQSKLELGPNGEVLLKASGNLKWQKFDAHFGDKCRFEIRENSEFIVNPDDIKPNSTKLDDMKPNNTKLDDTKPNNTKLDDMATNNTTLDSMKTNTITMLHDTKPINTKLECKNSIVTLGGKLNMNYNSELLLNWGDIIENEADQIYLKYENKLNIEYGSKISFQGGSLKMIYGAKLNLEGNSTMVLNQSAFFMRDSCSIKQTQKSRIKFEQCGRDIMKHETSQKALFWCKNTEVMLKEFSLINICWDTLVFFSPGKPNRIKSIVTIGKKSLFMTFNRVRVRIGEGVNITIEDFGSLVFQGSKYGTIQIKEKSMIHIPSRAKGGEKCVVILKRNETLNEEELAVVEPKPGDSSKVVVTGIEIVTGYPDPQKECIRNFEYKNDKKFLLKSQQSAEVEEDIKSLLTILGEHPLSN